MQNNRLMPTVAVIGAGISGLVCARTLADRGLTVTVFEKSRGVGGRMATRRTEHGVSFDHGAQYFTVRDERFQRGLSYWLDDGIVRPWTGRIVSLRDGRAEHDKSSTTRYVACPGMSAICKQLARNLQIRTNLQAGPPMRDGGQWRISDAAGNEAGRFDAVIISAPAPQAASLLLAAPDLAERASSVAVAGCWALLTQFSAPVDVDFDGAFVQDSALSWIARNSSKPGRDPAVETWIMHASADWSAAHLEAEPETVREHLLQSFHQATGTAAPPAYATVHRWRYALPVEPLPEPCLFDADRMIGACGDWCAGPRVEGAFLSGAATADRLLGLLSPSSPAKVD